MLTEDEIRSTAKFIKASQLSNGLIPWFEGGQIDPWNHLEAAIGLAVGSEPDAAIGALLALIKIQNRDGSFCHFYLAQGVKEPNRDTNVSSYIAMGLLGVMAYVEGYESEEVFASVSAALDYLVNLQRPDGGFPMLERPDGSLYLGSLLAGSCSILNAFEAGCVLAGYYEVERPTWKIAIQGLIEYLLGSRSLILDKSSWAMDWYYPALCGLGRYVDDDVSNEPLGVRSNGFFQPGLGVRCLKEKHWFTAAETAEAAMAHVLAGDRAMGAEMLGCVARFRRPDGGYYTGLVYPTDTSYPGDEASTYSAGAVLIANDVVRVGTRGSLASHFSDRVTKRRS